MICRTAEEAFQAGLNALCEHGIQPITACARCCLTAEEIRRLAVLLRHSAQPTAGLATAA